MKHALPILLMLCAAGCSDPPGSAIPVTSPNGTTSRALQVQVPGDFPSIQAAIDASSPGDVVLLTAAVYQEDLALRPGVVVQGKGVAKTVVHGRVTATAADGAGLQDLTLSGKLSGALADGISGVDSGLMLDRIAVTGFGGRGVVLKGGAVPHLDRVAVTQCGGVGVELDGAAGATLVNTVIAKNGGHGILVTTLTTVQPTIAHVLLFANGYATGGAGVRFAAGGGQLGNSILTSNYKGLDCGAVCTGGHNVVWGNSVDYAGAATSMPGDLHVDPRMVSPAEGDYHIGPDSSALDAASPNASPDHDMDGVARPQGAGPDIGPFERPVSDVATSVVISEVMANPLDESSGEFVELFNAGATPVDAAGLIIDDGDSTDPLIGWGGGPTLIPPGGYGVVLDPDYPGDTYAIPPEAVLLTVPTATIGSGLSTADPVSLRATDGTPIDTYSHPFNPGNGVSVEKDEVSDGDVATNWVASPCGSSPGAPNCASAPPVQGPPAALVINELMANPLEESTGEYVELLNGGIASIDLAGVVLSDGDSDDTLAGWQGGPTVLAPGQLAVVLDPDYAGQYTLPATALLLTIASSSTLGNGLSTDDPITLSAQDGSVLAAFTHPTDPGNGISLERLDPAPGDTASTFAPSTCVTGSSPGEPNCAGTGGGATTAVSVMVSEVMANAIDEDTGEFVELYNSGSEPVDLAGFRVSDGDKEEPLEAFVGGGPTVLAPGAYAVVLDREYAGEYTIPAGALLLTTPDTSIGSGLALNDPITLKAKTGTKVLSGFAFPFNPGNGVSAERIDLLAADLPGNWVASPCKASPGAPNCAGVAPTPEAPLVVAGLVISEVMSNPLDESTGEYVELYNAGPAPVDIEGYRLSDGDAEDALVGLGGGPTTLSPGGFALVLDPNYAGQYAIGAGTVLLSVGDASIGNGLSTSDPVALSTPDGELVATFSFPVNPGNGTSIEAATLLGGDVASNWVASACSLGQGDANTGASPGTRSCSDTHAAPTGTRGVGQPCPNGGADCASGLCAVATSGDDARCTQDCSGAACPSGAECVATSDPAWPALCVGDGAAEPAPELLINEIVFDGPGSDVDVFVELAGAPGAVLDGVELVGINGSTGGTYNSIILAGQVGQDGYFVVAHPKAKASFLAAADMLTTKVDFQNGPDTVALRYGGAVLDAVGYGSFSATDVFAGEGAAAPDQPPGKSLSRIPDGSDTDDNSVDFALADPTPGAANGEAVQAPSVGKLLISEVIISPTAAEMIEIHNPGASAVDLSNVYVSDTLYYWRITYGEGKPDSTDFRVHFPAGTTIPAGGYVTVSFETAAHFQAVYGMLPDFDLAPSVALAPAMEGEYTGSASLSNANEMLVLFYWDGASDLVTDLDYVIWGNAGQAVVKTGKQAGASTYLPDTPQNSQSIIPAPSAAAVTRCDDGEGAQVTSGGNGFGGTDETSEDLTATFQLLPAASPGGPGDCATVCVPSCSGAACGDDGCGGSCGVCGAGQICEVGECITPAGPLALMPVSWDAPAGTGVVEEVVLLTSAADFQTHFGASPPAGIDFGSQWALFYSAGLRNVPGHIAKVVDVVDNTSELFVFTELQLPGEGCEVLDWVKPTWTLVTFPKPSSGATDLTIIPGEDDVDCTAGGVPAGSECNDAKLCKSGLICCGTTWDFGLCFEAWMHAVFPVEGPLPIPSGDPAGLVSDVNVTGLATVPMDAIVKIHITHPNPSQLTLSLNMPPQWSGEPTYEDVFWDQEPTNGPDLTLHMPVGFVGDETVNGTWTLKVIDHGGGDGGEVVDWSLELTSRWD